MQISSLKLFKIFFVSIHSMMEMVVFAITLVVAQLLAGIVLLAVFMNRNFIKFYYKRIVRMMKDVLEDEE